MYVIERHEDRSTCMSVEVYGFYNNINEAMRKAKNIGERYPQSPIIFTGLTVPSTIIYHPLNGDYMDVDEYCGSFIVYLSDDRYDVAASCKELIRIREYAFGDYSQTLREIVVGRSICDAHIYDTAI
jgi:hypothetical protein